MTTAVVPASAELPPRSDRARAEAVAALHLAALRRQFDAIRKIFGNDPPHRSREALWVGLEVVLATLRGEQVALRDLVIRAEGLLSAPTLSRVVADLEREGLLTSEPAPPGQGRLKVLRPTARAMDILAARSDAAFVEFSEILREPAPEGRTGSCAEPNADPL
jgi:hypothetical protein